MQVNTAPVTLPGVLSCCKAMRRQVLQCFLSFLLTALAQAATVEHLIGTWTLSSQTIDGRKVDIEPLTLRIYPAGDAFEFAYSTPINGIHLVSMKFIGVHLNGEAGTVQDVKGQKMGTVRVSKVGPLSYKAVIEGANRPKAEGKMTISADDQTLTSESDTTAGGKGVTHAVQVFSRR